MILVVGEALVDLAVQADGSLEAHLGGGPFNAARTLGRLEVPTAYLGRVSTDRFGQQIVAALEADGVGLACVLRTDDPTTLALAELDERGAASYRFYLQGTSVPGVAPADAVAAAPAEVAALHVGTLALVVEPLAAASEALVERYAGRALVFVDPNIRPAALHDERTYRARLARVLAGADVVKVSDDDLAWLVPGAAPIDGARSLLDAGPRTVLVTLGARGAIVVGAGGVRAVPAPVVEVADTIGAGDSFGGGVLAWWDEHGRPELTDLDAAEAATTFGVRVAAVTVSRPGADPPRRRDVE